MPLNHLLIFPLILFFFFFFTYHKTQGGLCIWMLELAGPNEHKK